jgi:TonB-dependent SusC/RagA subfamily outer membrane receptor
VFTLFDPQGIEHCERLVFLNETKRLNVEISTDKKQYAPREKVELKIKTTDKDGTPIAAKISLAVADDQLISFADDKQNNILSTMLLSSEVYGEIQEPSFYFDASEPKAAQALDFLLMTQGWRRFTWKDVKEASKPIVYAPEKVTTLSGQVVHNGVGMQSQITMLELGNKRRIEKLQTTTNGHFLFKNIDPTIPILLLTKRPGEIAVQKEEAFSVVLNDKDKKTVLLPVQVTAAPAAASTIKTETSSPEDLESSSDMNLTLVDDVTSLSEVVVTGYGYENKRDLAASIATVSERDIDSKLPTVALENLLQGRVAGVVVQSQSGNPGTSPVIRIRGYSSLSSGRSEPLYVIDGFPMGTSLNQNFSNTGIIGPEDIQSVEIIASPEATSLYGSGAANGVILITTKSNLGHTPFTTTRKLSKYNGQTVYPRKYSATREFYVAIPSKNKGEDRRDFKTTLYWNHTIVTNESGEAQLSLHNNDATTAFRITAEGFSHSGLIGRTETTYFTQLPLALDTKLPEFLGFEDTLRLPVSIRNETIADVSGEITLRVPNELSIQESNTKSVHLKAHSAQTYTFTITTKSVEGNFPFSISLTTPGYTDKIDHKIRVQPIGFPARISFSSRGVDKTMQFKVDGAERGTIKAELTAFPDVISDLFAGAEAILQEPHGCFEQVSSSTFPNILALQFLKRSGDIRPEVEKRALRYIEDGYKKLAAYEIRDGGFEWFGHPPAHEGLTAYGLLEFHEMKKVFPKVSDAMMNRTRDWLLSRRNGKGGFKVNRGKYGFAGASEAVSNAYIVYALAETGTKEIAPEYLRALAEALESEDMYRMALIACASHTLEKTEQYTNLIDLFKQKVNSIGLPALRSDHSIVRSYGQSLLIETVSLWTIALLKSPDFDRSLAAECIKFIVDNRHYGYFGSTQGTTLALMALTEYAKAISLKREDGEIKILVNNKVSETAVYNKHVRKQITLNAFSGDIKPNGHQQVRIQFHRTSEPLPYSVNIQWYTKKPQSNGRCKVGISAELKQSTVQLNESVRLSTTLINKTTEGLPMVTAVVGIPAGLSVQPWQLKELQERKVFDFYEILNGNLVLYYREMGPEAKHVINLDLKAEMPGKFTGAASSAYLYYANEFKSWTGGNSISIY